MRFSIDQDGDVVVLTLKSSLEGEPETYRMKDAIKAEIEKGGRRFLIDMTKAKFVNSAGIGVLMAIYASVLSAEGQVKLCGMSDRARLAMRITLEGLWDRFEIYDTRAEALQAFAG